MLVEAGTGRARRMGLDTPPDHGHATVGNHREVPVGRRVFPGVQPSPTLASEPLGKGADRFFIPMRREAI